MDRLTKFFETEDRTNGFAIFITIGLLWTAFGALVIYTASTWLQ